MPRDDAASAGRVSVTAIGCAECAVGQYASSGSQFCPFIIRRYQAGTELFSARRPVAHYLWQVMDGVVGLYLDEQPRRVAELRLPGSVVSSMAAGVASAMVLSEATLCGATREAYDRWMDQVHGRDRDGEAPTVTRSLQLQNVTCPNSAHLEMIGYAGRSDGTIARIEACTAFEPHSAVDCDQLCAVRLNQRRRLELTRIGVAPPPGDQANRTEPE